MISSAVLDELNKKAARCGEMLQTSNLATVSGDWIRSLSVKRTPSDGDRYQLSVKIKAAGYPIHPLWVTAIAADEVKGTEKVRIGEDGTAIIHCLKGAMSLRFSHT